MNEPDAGRTTPNRHADSGLRARPTVARSVLRSMRPYQWLKNGFVGVPLIFGGPQLIAEGALDTLLVVKVIVAVACFCALSGAVYLLNDLLDVEADRQHPVKRKRPIAAGDLPAQTARTVFFIATVGSLLVGGLIHPLFALVAGGYAVLNVAYSLRLKRFAYFDVTLIAAGFILRVEAGGVAAGVRLSDWLLLCTFLLSMFLGLGKRRHELDTVDDPASHRAALGAYREGHLDLALNVLAAVTTFAYLGYTLSPETQAKFRTPDLVWTAPFAVFGLFRFLQLLHQSGAARSPTDRMIRDPTFLVNLGLWGAVTLGTIYHAM